ncbi:hypothetical protein Ddye_009861 [Dipteronia dyeriana]|uniref:MYB transcription factor n=1 Tax=Dipteronia dyeriana TaxID=168575 RepID=A0AAD9XC85_9ROSI|nr:hypothetical protein Ddye_009861 [Dipteronia dyeriana]
MGAPKQKWTAEEEAALKAGVHKHGTGKWRTILSDPEFNAILHSRSNVDLKDKWRNINVTAIWGSRQKAKLALKRNQLTTKRGGQTQLTPKRAGQTQPTPKRDGQTQPTPKRDGQTQPTPKRDGQTQPTTKHDEHHMALTIVPPNDEGIVDAKPLSVSSGTLLASGPKEPVARLDKLILDAITNLKEPSGSDRASITHYIEVSLTNNIEEQYWAPTNLKRLLATKLKFLVAKGTLIKVKHKYRIPSSETVPVAKKSPKLLQEGCQKGSPKLLLEGSQKGPPKAQKKDINSLKAQVDADLSRMRGMTAQEAAAAAAQAIAEAEIAIAEAEEAAKEAERAEAEAEAAHVFAKAAMKAIKCRLHTW